MGSAIYGVIAVASAIWVVIDASRLGAQRHRLGGGVFDMGPVSWFFAVLLLWIIAFPGYLWVRPRYVALLGQSQQTYGGPGSTPAAAAGYATAPYGGPLPAQAYPVPMQPAASATALPPWETARVTGPPPGAQISPDGHWWWDGSQWQPTAQ